MPKIFQMSPHLADLIAAGEVVERPASVVKELLENAIDAGATSITVELQRGGAGYIRVSDNGCGIAPEDMKTAFLRHASSKLLREEELEGIRTLGFRGEALAAIAAVSRVDLLSRTEDGPGFALSLEGGIAGEPEAAGCPRGTTMIVRDLFYNTPARLKYMKKDSAEGAAAAAVCGRIALARPDVSIKLIRDGREEMHSPGDGKLSSAVYAVLGRDIASAMLPAAGEFEGIRCEGFISKPTAGRGNRNYQHFFVNGRWIKSRLMCAALEEAYKNRLMSGKYPACVIRLTMRPEALDVNVHPAKTEVKFSSERAVFDSVYYAAMGALEKDTGKPEISRSAGLRASVQPAADFWKSAPAAELKSGQAGAVFKKPGPQSSGFFKNTEFSAPVELRSPVAANWQAPPAKPSGTVPEPAVVPNTAPEPAAVPETEPKQEEIPGTSAPAPWRLIGELHSSYILVEEEAGLLLIDKHAAHERVLFEELKARGGEAMCQSLLAPLIIAPAPEERGLLLEHAELLRDIGYELEDFGGGSISLRAVPEGVDLDDAPAALSELASLLQSGGRADSLRDELLHSVACKAAVKAGSRSDERELMQLAKAVMEREDVKYCPHGRPVAISLSRGRIEREFKR